MIETKTHKINEIQTLIEKTEQSHTYKPGNHQRMVKFKLTPSDKIAFAYDYYNIVGDTSILEVLKQIPKENGELIRTIIKFIIGHNLIKPFPNSPYEYINPLPLNEINKQRMQAMNIASIIREYDYQNWLELFDEDAIFAETKTKHPSYRIFMDANGHKIKFDKDLSTQVKLAIVNQGIAPARCIVEGAYPHVVKGTFQEYTDKIKNKTL